MRSGLSGVDQKSAQKYMGHAIHDEEEAIMNSLNTSGASIAASSSASPAAKVANPQIASPSSSKPTRSQGVSNN